MGFASRVGGKGPFAVGGVLCRFCEVSREGQSKEFERVLVGWWIDCFDGICPYIHTLVQAARIFHGVESSAGASGSLCCASWQADAAASSPSYYIQHQ